MTTKTKLLAALCGLFLAAPAIAQQPPQPVKNKPPNIVVIWGDDVGMWNVGAYTHGMMGRTPNIDGIAKDGILFTDHYGQPSCTAGRAASATATNSSRPCTASMNGSGISTT